jgi:hypothetical protein
MIERTASAMGKKRLVFSVPVFSLGLSKFWVGFFGNSPSELVSPLVESLKHQLTVNPKLAFDQKPMDYLSYEEAVKEAWTLPKNQRPRFFTRKKE